MHIFASPLKNYLTLLYAYLDRSKNVISFQRHVTIKILRIARRSTIPKYLINMQYFVLEMSQMERSRFWYFHGQINFGSKSDKDKYITIQNLP